MHSSQQRLLIALALVLSGLVGIIRWIEPSGDDTDFEDPVDVSEDQLERLVLETEAGRLEAERTEGGWLLTHPLRARADDDAIAGLVGLVDRLRTGPELEGLDPDVYGFTEPEAVLTLVREDGGTHKLAVGTTAPVGFRTYIRLDDGAIRLAEGHPMTTLGRPTNTLRDRAVHDFAESAVTGLRWHDEGRTWAVTRRDGSWFLGDGRRASSQRVLAVLRALSDMRLESFQDGVEPEDLPRLGLEPPHAALTLTGPEGEATLEIGGERFGGVLVRSPSGQIGTVGDIADLLSPPGTLLEDRLLPFSLNEATALYLSFAGVEITLTPEGSAWLRNGELSPAASAQAVDLLTQLVADRAQVLEPGEPGGDHLSATAGAYTVRVELGVAMEGGRLAWTVGEPAFLVPTDSLVVLENVALGLPPVE